MAPKIRTTILGPIEVSPYMDVINLRWIFAQDNENLLKFLAYHGLIKNQMNCPNCANLMGLNKKGDDFVWYCRPCRKMKTVRDGSFFQQSSLPIKTLLPLVYTWVEDFRNKNAIKELDPITPTTVVNWFNFCRTECRQERKRIGGRGKIIEIDETCWVKQKHHRGMPKKGTQIWYFVCIERGPGGQAIAARVKDRKQQTLFKLIKKWIRPGTLIISDEWPVYLRLEFRLPQYRFLNRILQFYNILIIGTCSFDIRKRQEGAFLNWCKWMMAAS